MTEQEKAATIESLKRGDEKAFKAIYLDTKSQFIPWIKTQYGLNEDNALDLYQSAFSVFYEKVEGGSFNFSQSAPATYIIAIGKNLALKTLKQNSKVLDPKELIFQHYTQEDGEEKKVLLKKMLLGLEQLKEPCKTLLEMYYYKKMSLKEIGNKMNHGNANVTKTQKSRCLNYLKKLIKKDK